MKTALTPGRNERAGAHCLEDWTGGAERERASARLYQFAIVTAAALLLFSTSIL